MKVSIICPVHRWGGIDILEYGLERQTFPKEDFELLLCDKLYKERKDLIYIWAKDNDINVIHFSPKNRSEYHVHSSVLNECLERAMGEYTIVIGDYSYFDSNFIDIHYQYNRAGYTLSSPQRIYGLPKLSTSLEHPISIFRDEFTPEVLKILPQFRLDNGSELDPKIHLPNGTLIDFHYWYNRNESFPTEVAREIGGWDEAYNNRVGESNIEFGLRMQYEGKQTIVCDGRATIHRIMSYAIPPFTSFLSDETDGSINHERYKLLCEKYGVK